MLSFRKGTAFFLLLITGIIAAHCLWQLSLLWIAFPLLLYSVFLAYGSAYIGSAVFIPVVCRAHTNKKQIALTFDDGPHKENTGLILDVLKRNHVPAAFFCIGKQMFAHKQLLKRIDEEGHIIGNHSYSHHYFFDFFSAKRFLNELEETDKIVEEVIHKKVKLFRPPYGVTTPNLARAVKKRGYKTIGWSIRSMDTQIKDEEGLLDKLTQLNSGDILLFHDTVTLTVNTLQLVIDVIKQQNYEIIRLDKLLNIEAYAQK